MTNTYKTLNPLGSNNARDLSDNASNFDEYMNSDLPSIKDRFDKRRETLAGNQVAFDDAQEGRAQEFTDAQSGRESEFNADQSERDTAFQSFLDGTGWSSLGAYTAGISIISHTQTVDYLGQPYQLKPSIPASLDAPYVTTGVWATEGINFKLVGDNSLRQEIANAADPAKGAALVGYPAQDGHPASTVFTRLSYLDGVSPPTTSADASSRASVNSLRDTSAVVGGAPGFVNAGIWHKTIAGAAETAFEWGIVSVMDNNAATGENVAIFGQGNKLAVGPTWAGVFEARDKTGVQNPAAGLVGIEIDTMGNGTDGNARRIGLDIVVGRHNPAGATMESAYGIRISAFGANMAEGRVQRGFAMGAIEFDCAFDSSQGSQSSVGVAFRMAKSQKLSFTANNDRTMLFAGGLLHYQVDGATRHSISDAGATDQTGVLNILGTQILTSRRTGYTNPLSGTSNKTTAYDTSTITLQQLAERVKALLDDLTVHGIIGA